MNSMKKKAAPRGRGRPSAVGSAREERVTIRLTSEERALLEEQAAGEDLAQWIRSAALDRARRIRRR